MKVKLLLLFLVLISGLFVRLYNFENRIIFGSEQARSLVVSGTYISTKPSLLGQEYFRVTSKGHKLFSGAIFSYSLVPLQLLFRYEPIPITLYFALLNVFIGLILFSLVQKTYNFKIAIFALIIFLFNNFMIHHSMFIWILNYYPLIGLLFLYVLHLYVKNPKFKFVFLLGILGGVAVNFHYLFIPFYIAFLIYAIYREKEKLKTLSIIIAGTLLGNFTMVIFDLRNDFYHAKTLFQYVLDVVGGSGEGSLVYYHLLHLWPLFAILGALLLNRLWKLNKLICIVVIFIYIYLNLSSSKVNFHSPSEGPPGLTYEKISMAAKLIAEDVEGEFNVSSTLDFDKRGYILRYPLVYLYHLKPQGELDYESSYQLYVLTQKNYDFEKDRTWELRSLYPYEIEKISNIGEEFEVYKLNKIL